MSYQDLMSELQAKLEVYTDLDSSCFATYVTNLIELCDWVYHPEVETPESTVAALLYELQRAYHIYSTQYRIKETAVTHTRIEHELVWAGDEE